MPSILIVCTANICRSPMAEALLRRRLQDAGLSREWQVGSAGTWAQEGIPASETGVLVLSKRGLDISRHRSRVVRPHLMREADLVLTMTAGHAEALQAEFPQERGKVFLLSEMAGPSYDIQDPYGGSLKDFGRTVDELERLIARGFAKIVALAQANADEKALGQNPPADQGHWA